MFMCSSLGIRDNEVVSFDGIFDSVIPIKEDNRYFVENLNIILNATIIFDERYGSSNDYFKLHQNYEFMIWMTHVDSARGVSLLNFEKKVERSDLRTWCKDFYEFKKILRIPRICIPKGLGKYAIKLLIRPVTEANTTGWHTQTIHSLMVGETR